MHTSPILNVVTQTRPSWNRDISQCLASVEAALPEGAVHHLVITEADLMRSRREMLKLGGYLAIVDDDDFISADSLTACVAALEATGAGIAFTNEVVVNPRGDPIYRNDFKRFYEHAALKANVIHHLAVFRAELVPPEALEIAEKYQIQVEWPMKVAVAFQHGAVHVPIDGYFWRMHHNQHHKQAHWETNAKTHLGSITRDLQSLMKHRGPIPIFEGNT